MRKLKLGSIRKIVVASDSFKGSLTSMQVADAVADGIHRVDPTIEVIRLAVGDGGEGTAEAIATATEASRVSCMVSDPIGRPIMADYAIATRDDTQIGIIEMAKASGLTLVAEAERDVMRSSTVGTGELIIDAYNHGCRQFMIAIGGSATCDGGMGMLAALGVRFLDKENRQLEPSASNLILIETIDLSHSRADIMQCRLTVICDVTNPLTGEMGAARVFAPQKGATPNQVVILETGLTNYAELLASATGVDVAHRPGSGAAGGLGAALLTLPHCTLRSGVDAVLDIVGFDEHVADADLVITGEGCLDKQTLLGKLPMGVCRRARRMGVPVIAIGGKVECGDELLDHGFSSVAAISDPTVAPEISMRPDVARRNISDYCATFRGIFERRKDSDAEDNGAEDNGMIMISARRGSGKIPDSSGQG